MSQNRDIKLLIAVHLLFLASSYFIINSFGYTMLDDGWRHMAMAFDQNELKSWGNIFINSLYKEYDPWFMWHNLLYFVGNIVGENQVPIIINSLVYFALSSWIFYLLNHYSQFNIYFKILFALGLPLMTIRYYYLRPDVLSGLLLLSIITIKNSRILLFITALIYMPFYYIFWFYFGYIAFIKFVLKEYKTVILYILLTILGFMFHLGYDYDGYIHMMQNVLNNDALISKYAVTESRAFLVPDVFREILGSGKLLLVLMLMSYLFFLVLKPQNRLIQYALLLTPLILVQYRFFHLLQPFLVSLGLILLYQLYEQIKKHGIDATLKNALLVIQEKSYFTKPSSKTLTILFFVACSYFFISKYISNIKTYEYEHTLTKASSIFKDPEFKDKRILLSTMDGILFRAIYFNPSGKYMPNCSIGWVDFEPKMKEIYFKVITNDTTLTKNELFEFIKFNNFDFFILIATKSTNMAFTNKEMEDLGYYFQKITGGNLIFKRKIKKNKL